MSIDSFKQHIASKGILRTNRFAITISSGVPGSVISDAAVQLGLTNTDMNFACVATSFPGRTMEATERNVASGPPMKITRNHTNTDIKMSFRENSLGSVRAFFDIWHRYIQDLSNSWTFHYPDQYMGDLLIEQKDTRDVTVYSASVIDAWPTDISEYTMSHNTPNEYLVFDVNFVYRTFILNPLADPLGSVFSPGE